MLVELESGVAMAVSEARNFAFSDLRFQAVNTFQDIIATFGRTILKKKVDFPVKSPWIVALLGKSAVEVVNAKYQIYNLNDPPVFDDVSWIAPGKVIRDMQLSTESSKEVIDVLEQIGGKYVLLDAGWYGPETNPASDATTWLKNPKKAPLDIEVITQYGKSKGIGVILYVNDIALSRQLEDILPLYNQWGVAGIKFGFVELDKSEDIARILHYVKRCGEHRLVVNIHDNYRPSGISRTYPNLLSIEGIRGDEHTPNAKHSVMLPFLRYTYGVRLAFPVDWPQRWRFITTLSRGPVRRSRPYPPRPAGGRRRALMSWLLPPPATRHR